MVSEAKTLPIQGQAEKGIFERIGDVNFLKCTLTTHDGSKTVDLLPLIESFIFTEDLFTSTMSGTAMLRDTVDLHNFFPIRGEETIKAFFSIPGMKDQVIDVEFRVYAMTRPVIALGDNIKTYVLSFISEEQITDSFKKVRRAFKEAPGKIIEDILKVDLATKKDVFIEESGAALRAVIPNWEPFKAISFLSRKTVSKEKEDPSIFLFYEDLKGFHFDTVHNIILRGLDNFEKNPDLLKLRYRVTIFSEEHTENPFQRVIELATGGDVNTLAQTKLGVFKNIALNFDMINKKIDDTLNYDYKKDFDIIKTGLGQFKVASDSFISEVQDDFGIEMLFASDIGFDIESEANDVMAAVARYRAAFLNLLSEFQIQVVTSGNNFIALGDVIELEIPKTTGLQLSKFVEDEFLRGKYLVIAIKHEIVGTIAYHTTYNLVRADSVIDINEIIAE